MTFLERFSNCQHAQLKYVAGVVQLFRAGIEKQLPSLSGTKLIFIHNKSIDGVSDNHSFRLPIHSRRENADLMLLKIIPQDVGGKNRMMRKGVGLFGQRVKRTGGMKHRLVLLNQIDEF